MHCGLVQGCQTQIELELIKLGQIMNFFQLAKLYLVGCQGVVQQVGIEQGSPGLVPLRLRLISLFLFTKGSLVLKMKSTLGRC